MNRLVSAPATSLRILRTSLHRPNSLAPSCYMISRSFSSRLYTPEHEWVTLSEDKKVATIGISDYAQKALGDIVYVEVPSPGTSIQKKDAVGAVESVKAASDVYAPLSGEVIESNEHLVKEPTLVNIAPHTDGWLCKIQLSKPDELSSLMNEEAYKKHCEEDTHV